MKHIPSPELQPLKTHSLALSAQDVRRLLTEETPDVRIEVLAKVSEGHSKQHYNPRELAIAEQIFRVLLKDTEVRVREALAHALKDNPKVSHDIILALTRDADTVSLPIIQFSDVLSDADLLAIIKTAKQANKQVAVAKRKHVSQEVSSALAETHNAHVAAELLQNLGTVISDEAYQLILRDHSKNTGVMNAVAARPNLPPTVVEKVITVVSDTLADKLRTQYKIAPATIAIETEKTREVATLKLVDGKINAQDVERLVDQLQVFGRLSPSMILTSLCRGNLYFFETSLARLSNIPVRNAQLLIHDKGGLGFKALYTKAGLPDKFFNACQRLLHIVADMQRSGIAESGAQYANTLVQKLLAQSAGQDVENLSYIIALIRQSA